jgi:hypothetical protein
MKEAIANLEIFSLLEKGDEAVSRYHGHRRNDFWTSEIYIKIETFN